MEVWVARRCVFGVWAFACRRVAESAAGTTERAFFLRGVREQKRQSAALGPKLGVSPDGRRSVAGRRTKVVSVGPLSPDGSPGGGRGGHCGPTTGQAVRAPAGVRPVTATARTECCMQLSDEVRPASPGNPGRPAPAPSSCRTRARAEISPKKIALRGSARVAARGPAVTVPGHHDTQARGLSE